MKVTICFGEVKVIVPCSKSSILGIGGSNSNSASVGLDESKLALSKSAKSIIEETNIQFSKSNDDFKTNSTNNNQHQQQQIRATYSFNNTNDLAAAANGLGTEFNQLSNSCGVRVKDVIENAISRFKKATGKSRRESLPKVSNVNYFSRVNTNRQSIIKNENNLWSNSSTLNSQHNQQHSSNQSNELALNNKQISNFQSATNSANNNNNFNNQNVSYSTPSAAAYSPKQTDMGLIIQRIEPNGRVYKDGRLRAGDRIIEINKKSLSGVDFLKAQEILRDAIKQSNALTPTTTTTTTPSTLDNNNETNLEFKLVRCQTNTNTEDSTTTTMTTTLQQDIPSSSTTPITPQQRSQSQPSSPPRPPSTTTTTIRNALDVADYYDNNLENDEIINERPIEAEDYEFDHSNGNLLVETPNEIENDELNEQNNYDEADCNCNKLNERENNKENEFMSKQDNHHHHHQHHQHQHQQHKTSHHDDSNGVNSASGYLSNPSSINMNALNTKKLGKKITVQLVEGPQGLGFKLAARDNCAPGEFSPIYIKNILPKGAAITDGRLQRGDRLLEVNKMNMTLKTLHEAVNILRNTKLGSVVELVVSRQVIPNMASQLKLMTTNGSINNSFSLNAQTNLISSQNSSGIGVSSFYHHRDKELSGIAAAQLPRELDEQDHQNGSGDHNSQDLTTTTSTDQHGNQHHHHTKQQQQDNETGANTTGVSRRQLLTFEIALNETGSAGLGVSVKGKTKRIEENDCSIDLGIFIKTVINGGAASKDGRLRPNDQLININGFSLLGKSNEEAMLILREAMQVESKPGHIQLTVSRKLKPSQANELNAQLVAAATTTSNNSATTPSTSTSVKQTLPAGNGTGSDDMSGANENLYNQRQQSPRRVGIKGYLTDLNNQTEDLDDDDHLNEIRLKHLTMSHSPDKQNLYGDDQSSDVRAANGASTTTTTTTAIQQSVVKIIQNQSPLKQLQLANQISTKNDDDISLMGNRFSRDAPNRRSMSEKRAKYGATGPIMGHSHTSYAIGKHHHQRPNLNNYTQQASLIDQNPKRSQTVGLISVTEQILKQPNSALAINSKTLAKNFKPNQVQPMKNSRRRLKKAHSEQQELKIQKQRREFISISSTTTKTIRIKLKLH